MALYAFDGTRNQDEPGDGEDSNVVKFCEAYTGDSWCLESVGTRLGFIGNVLGGREHNEPLTGVRVVRDGA